MKSFFDYYDLTKTEKTELLKKEKKHSTKFYIAETLEDLVSNSNIVKHSDFGLINVFLQNPIKLYLDDCSAFDDIRELQMRTFGIKLPLTSFKYEYPYVITTASESFQEKTNIIGLSSNILFDLLEEGTDTIYVNSHFSHFLGQTYPELIDFDKNINYKKKSPKTKPESKLKTNFGLVYN